MAGKSRGVTRRALAIGSGNRSSGHEPNSRFDGQQLRDLVLADLLLEHQRQRRLAAPSRSCGLPGAWTSHAETPANRYGCIAPGHQRRTRGSACVSPTSGRRPACIAARAPSCSSHRPGRRRALARSTPASPVCVLLALVDLAVEDQPAAEVDAEATFEYTSSGENADSRSDTPAHSLKPVPR